MGNNLSHYKETGSRQLNKEAAKNDVMTENIRSRLPTTKNKTKKVATSNRSHDIFHKLMTTNSVVTRSFKSRPE